MPAAPPQPPVKPRRCKVALKQSHHALHLSYRPRNWPVGILLSLLLLAGAAFSISLAYVLVRHPSVIALVMMVSSLTTDLVLVGILITCVLFR